MSSPSSSWIPSTSEGYLPYFLLYASIAALLHSTTTYLKPISAIIQFSGPKAPPKTPLLAHVYGVKNFYTGLIRLYAAYNIHNGPVYDLAMATFAGVLFLFATEYFIWGTVRSREVGFPLVTGGLGFVWMVMQRGVYVVG